MRTVLSELREAGSYDVRTPTDAPLLHTIVYLDGDVMTRVVGGLTDQVVAAHFAEVAKRSAAATSRLRTIARLLKSVRLVIALLLWLAFHGSPAAIVELTGGLMLSTLADRHWLRSTRMWVREGLQVGVPVSVAVAMRTFGLGLSLSSAALAVGLSNLLVAIMWAHLRRRVVQALKRA
jgi:hypothetical protein